VNQIDDYNLQDNEYPNNINPNANSGATLALERAKMAMSVAGQSGASASELRNALLDQGDLDPDDGPEGTKD